MSRNLSYKGKGQDTGPVALPVGDDLQAASPAKRNGKSASRLSLSTPSARRTDRAIDDAQSSLESLIKAPYEHSDRSRPQVISSSGRIRNETRGRVAAPSSLTGETRSTSRTARPLYILGEGRDVDDDKALAVVPGTVPLYGSDGETRQVPNTALGRGMALATGTLQTAKEHAGLLLGTLDSPGGLGLADDETLHTTRRAASQWATRYATHLVVLLVVGVLVALGGLRALTTDGAYSTEMHSAEEFGTDHVHDGEEEFGGQAIDSPDFVIALPRTELGGADAAANSIVAPLAPSGEEAQVQPQPQTPSAPAPAPIARTTEYTVVAGDTVGSIAARFNVMPETVMGSNGIYDPEEVLAAGRVLMVPPIDGMHYVAKEGDTVQSIAERFQVDTEVITSFAGNNLANGTVAAGQAVIVPGGMMPPRDVAIIYTVRKGDTLKRVAARYGIDVPTIVHANDIPDPDNPVIGSQLRLLPVPGLEYEIKKGDTIFSIADKLGVNAEMILDYPPNNLKADSVLQIGAKIMVPGGSPPVVMAARVAPPAKEAPAPQPKQQPAQSKAANQPAAAVKPPPKAEPAPKPKPQQPAANTPKKGTGSMVWPVRGRITQYFSGRHNGLDIATRAGTPIHAADSGKIIWSGWRTDGLGYAVIIDHLNGLTTIYGHMIRQPPVRVGQYVDRNQVIGYIGSTGRSTGPHVHFMVKSGGGKTYRNPLAYLGK